jgi:hypothetical protein
MVHEDADAGGCWRDQGEAATEPDSPPRLPRQLLRRAKAPLGCEASLVITSRRTIDNGTRNSLVHTAIYAGMSRTTSVNLPELIS